LEEVPSLQETMVVAVVDEAAVDGVAVAAGAAAAVAAGAVAVLLTPPWPLQAPLPPLGEVVPSLQVTGPLLEEVDVAAAGAAGAAASVADWAACSPATAAALFTPPWPLHAPRPPCELVPSLQVTVVVLAS
jgi:hypothetical protein